MDKGWWCCGSVWQKSIFFFNDTATTEIYTLSLHDALPIFRPLLVNYLLRLSSIRHPQLSPLLQPFPFPPGAIELLITAVVAWLLFGVGMNAQMLVSIGLVSAAMWLYSTQPVHNKAKTPPAPAKADQKRLLDEEEV